jgi:hypothetical protein
VSWRKNIRLSARAAPSNSSLTPIPPSSPSVTASIARGRPAVKRLAEIGQQIPTLEQQTPKALDKYQKDEIARWWPVIKAANIKGE